MLLNLLRALGKAASFPKHFEVILRERSLPDQAFNLPPYVEPVIHDVLANLRTLYLDLNPESLEFDVEVNGRPIRCRSYLLRRFLAKVPQLEHLRLNFQSYGAGPPNPYAPKRETSNVLLWLSQKAPDIISPPPSNSQLLQTPPPVAFTQLRELDIGMTTTEPKILLSIVQKFKATLRVISLHRITLSETGSAAGKTRVNLWAKFFRDLAKLDPNFSEMNMSHLTQMQPGREHLRGIEFKGARDPKVRKWAANDTQSGLRDLAEETVVLGLDRDTESEGSTCGKRLVELRQSMHIISFFNLLCFLDFRQYLVPFMTSGCANYSRQNLCTCQAMPMKMATMIVTWTRIKMFGTKCEP
jgi:hypothetical protein